MCSEVGPKDTEARPKDMLPNIKDGDVTNADPRAEVLRADMALVPQRRWKKRLASHSEKPIW